MSKKGFTLVEVLAVITILGMVALITVPVISRVIRQSSDNIFHSDERTLSMAGENYYGVNQPLLPTDMYEREYVMLTTLADNGYLKNIKNPRNSAETCVGYVIVQKTGDSRYDYTPYLKCGTSYQTSGYVSTPSLSSLGPFKSNFGGSEIDVFNGAALLNDNYVAVGYSMSPSNNGDLSGITMHGTDALLTNFYLGGSVAWAKNYGGNGSDVFNDVIAVADGLVAVGSTDSTDIPNITAKGLQDALIVKFDNNGNLLWNKSYGGSGNESFTGIIFTGDGYVAAGYSEGSNDGDLVGLNKGSTDAIIVKYDLNGNAVWKKNYGGVGVDGFGSLSLMPDGYLAVGKSSSNNGDMVGLNHGNNNYEAILVKYDFNGNVVWNRSFGGTGTDEFYSVTNANNNYIAVGYSNSNDGDLAGMNKGGYDAIVVKYDNNGNLLWKRNYGGSGDEYFNKAASIDGNYVIVGQSSSTNGDLTGLNKGSADAIAVKYDSNGNVLTKANYGGTLADVFQSIIKVDTKYVTVGYSWSTNGDITNNKGKADGIIFALP